MPSEVGSEKNTGHAAASAHPDGGSGRTGRGLWIGLAAVVLIAAGAWAVFGRGKSDDQAKAGGPKPGAVPAVTSTAHVGDIEVYLEALGIVTPVYTVKVTSRVQGQITQIRFQEGQIVHKGDPLLDIDPRPYQAALAQAEGHLAHDQAVLKQAQIDLTRYKSAYEQKVIPKQQYEDQVQIARQDEGTVKEDEGAAAAARLNVEYCHMTSPIEGRVGLRQVDAGNMIDASSTKVLAVITQLKPIDVVFSVAEDHLAEVQNQVANGAKLLVEVYDRNQSKKLATGTLITIDNIVDTTTGTVKLKAEFANDAAELFPNQFVNVKLRVTTEKNQTLVPTLAIQRNAQGPFLYVVKSDQTVELRPIKAGAADPKDTAVTGVKPGEVIVVSGFDKIQEGVKIAAQSQVPAISVESAQ